MTVETKSKMDCGGQQANIFHAKGLSKEGQRVVDNSNGISG